MSLDIIVDRIHIPFFGALRLDASAERLHTLSSESLNLVDQVPDDRPVLIQAYYSPEVPREFVETKDDVLGLLREYASRSRGKIQLNLVLTDLYSDEAREAEKQFSIQPRRVFTADQGKQMFTEIFLGVAFTSGLEEVVIPFFDRGLPVEYELTRSIRVVSRSGRKKVGFQYRRQDDGRVRHAELQPEPGVVDRYRAEEAVRCQHGLARHTDHGRHQRPAGRPALFVDAEADRQPDRLCEKGRGHTAVPRPVPVREPDDLA